MFFYNETGRRPRLVLTFCSDCQNLKNLYRTEEFDLASKNILYGVPQGRSE